jgi:hypothetical protein
MRLLPSVAELTPSALAAQAARLTLVQLLINSKGLQMNPIQSLYYVSPACFVCLSVPFGALLLTASVMRACTGCKHSFNDLCPLCPNRAGCM